MILPLPPPPAIDERPGRILFTNRSSLPDEDAGDDVEVAAAAAAREACELVAVEVAQLAGAGGVDADDDDDVRLDDVVVVVEPEKVEEAPVMPKRRSAAWLWSRRFGA